MTMRESAMLGYEGQLLQFAANAGEDRASESAFGTIDGAFNALVRFEGPKSAAEFAYAIGDRLVARIKTPTPWPPGAVADDEEDDEPVPAPDPEPPKPESRRFGFWPIWFGGWCCGAMTVVGISDPVVHFIAAIFR